MISKSILNSKIPLIQISGFGCFCHNTFTKNHSIPVHTAHQHASYASAKKSSTFASSFGTWLQAMLSRKDRIENRNLAKVIV